MRQPPYTRAKRPTPMRLTDRDIRILETIHACDGLLSLRQIDQLFFSGLGRSQPRARMRLLFDNGYVAMPSPEEIHRIPRGETVYWLDRKGAAVVAAQQGLILKGFAWRKKPRYSLIAHDLAVTDFRLLVQTAITTYSQLQMGEWVSEGEFLAQPDTITYPTHNGKTRKRQVRPDGFFTLLPPHNTSPLAFLLEIDMSTEDNPRFAREKVKPGVAYLKSQAYRQRFGLRYGRYLVVTTGQRRLANMKTQTVRSGGTGLFYFTTFAELTPETIFTDPIWHLAGKAQPQSIIPRRSSIPSPIHASSQIILSAQSQVSLG